MPVWQIGVVVWSEELWVGNWRCGWRIGAPPLHRVYCPCTKLCTSSVHLDRQSSGHTSGDRTGHSWGDTQASTEAQTVWLTSQPNHWLKIWVSGCVSACGV